MVKSLADRADVIRQYIIPNYVESLLKDLDQFGGKKYQDLYRKVEQLSQ